MLRWAFAFLILAIVAGILGFGGVAAASAGIAKVLFALFLIIFFVIRGRCVRKQENTLSVR